MVLSDVNFNQQIEFYKSFYNELEIDNGKKIIRKFTSVRDEYNSLLSGVGLRDISGNGLIEITGKDSLDYLHRISTNAVNNLSPDSTIFTIFTNEKGRIIDRTLVANLGESLLLFGSNANKKKLYGWINKYIIMEDIKTFDASVKYTVFELTGAQANSFLISFFGMEISNLNLNEIKRLYFENYRFNIIKLKDFGIDKYIIYSDYISAIYLIRSMKENKSVFDFNIVGDDAYRIFRIEKGIPDAPNEINDNYNPYEIGIIKDVSFSKGCYIGQEVIARLDTYDKVQKSLRGVIFNKPVEEGRAYSIVSKNIEVGLITSYVDSFLLKRTIGIGIIKKEFSIENSGLMARDNHGKETEITLCNLPFRK